MLAPLFTILMTITATTLRTVNDLVPNTLPFFSPRKRTQTLGTYFLWKMRLFHVLMIAQPCPKVDAFLLTDATLKSIFY